MKKLTKQEADQHPRLAECRNAISSTLGLTRSHAAAVCNRMEHDQVEAVLAADGDKAKVQAAVEKVAKEPEPEPAKEPPKLKQSSKRK